MTGNPQVSCMPQTLLPIHAGRRHTLTSPYLLPLLLLPAPVSRGGALHAVHAKPVNLPHRVCSHVQAFYSGHEAARYHTCPVTVTLQRELTVRALELAGGALRACMHAWWQLGRQVAAVRHLPHTYVGGPAWQAAPDHIHSPID